MRLSSSSSMRSRSHSVFAGSSVRLTETSDVATTSTLRPSVLNISNTLARNPIWPSIRVLTMSTRVTLRLSTMLVTRSSPSFMSLVLEMRVPAAVRL